jgi:hypothetical protein
VSKTKSQGRVGQTFAVLRGLPTLPESMSAVLYALSNTGVREDVQEIEIADDAEVLLRKVFVRKLHLRLSSLGERGHLWLDAEGSCYRSC